MKFVSFGKIGQFKNIVKDVTHTTQFIGMGDNGPLFNQFVELPTLTFRGTVKCHGTNASIGYDVSTGEIWVQSRSRIITPEDDNMGFASFVHANLDSIRCMFEDIEFGNMYNDDDTIIVFGEWCGGNIQKGVALSQLQKQFIIFDVKVDDEFLDDITGVGASCDGIYNITDFESFLIDIDFNNPKLSVNSLTELTNKVEECCPVGKAFGVNGIGEGIVWTTFYKGTQYKFKVKGDKHSASKVKKLANVDIEKMESINKFVEYYVTENRLNQGIEVVFSSNNIEPEIKKTGDFVKWVKGDILAEELDVILESGLEVNDVTSSIGKTASKWFIEFLHNKPTYSLI